MKPRFSSKRFITWTTSTYLSVAQNIDAIGLNLFSDSFADHLVEITQNCVAANEERNFRAERVKNLVHLDCDVSGSDNDRFPVKVVFGQMK